MLNVLKYKQNKTNSRFIYENITEAKISEFIISEWLLQEYFSDMNV